MPGICNGCSFSGFAFKCSKSGKFSLSSTLCRLCTDSLKWGAVAITFLFFYYAAFGCTWGMVPWVYQAEINSLAMRTKGAAAATATNWLFGFVCTQFTPTGIKNIGYRFYVSKSLRKPHNLLMKLTNLRSFCRIQPPLCSSSLLLLSRDCKSYTRRLR